jgi:AcrR family transcriptional regulator
MALERFNHLPEARQREILTIAAERFAAEGFEGTSYNELLRALGFGKSQAYYYFESKQDLFVTACRACYADFYQQVSAQPEPQSAEEFWARLRENTLLGFHYQKTHHLAARLSLAIARSPAGEALSSEVVMGDPEGRRAYDAWLDLGRRLGAVRADLPEGVDRRLSLSLSALVDAWFAERAQDAEPEEMESWARLFGDLYERALAPRQFPKRASGHEDESEEESSCNS